MRTVEEKEVMAQFGLHGGIKEVNKRERVKKLFEVKKIRDFLFQGD